MFWQIDYYLISPNNLKDFGNFPVEERSKAQTFFFFGSCTFVKHHSGRNIWKLSWYHSKLRASFQSEDSSADSWRGKEDTWRKSKFQLPPFRGDKSWTSAKYMVTWGSKWLWPSPRAVPLFPQRSSEDLEKASGLPTATQLSGTGLSPKLNLTYQIPPSFNIGHSRTKLHCCMLCPNSTLHITQLTLLLYPASTLVH